MARAATLRCAAAVLLCLAALANARIDDNGIELHDDELYDESDSAPFMIVVEHTDGRRCSGSLVSLRTALTSVWCVRGERVTEPRELYARAPGAPPVARRVARVALAAAAHADAHLQPAWLGAALDIAVLELEAPLGAAHVRPILMAASADDCASDAACHVVRALGPARLRIVDASLVAGRQCGASASGWPALRDIALCLAGPTLCSRDRGAGVVCGGKLCGVLSRSARGEAWAPAANGSDASDRSCGDVHVAQSVWRWRRFLHCAHTLRACGSSGECAELCNERQLMVTGAYRGTELATRTPAPTAPYTPSARPTPTTLTERLHYNTPPSPLHKYEKQLSSPSRTHGYVRQDADASELSKAAAAAARWFTRREDAVRRAMPTHTSTRMSSPRRAAITSEPTTTTSLHSRRGAEFEPNRPDFKAGPARTSRICLKAGEYGDNAANYEEDEPAPLEAPTPASIADALTPASAAAVPSPTDSTRQPALAARRCADNATHTRRPFDTPTRSDAAQLSGLCIAIVVIKICIR